ncbi:MAG TPA: sugar nucleotide-binding protein [Egibacteraceae bacterium]|nr:sugar nucleotide-binding protein [Egibacteraceae bacterium]
MRVYVTGGTGFVGSNVVKVMTERHSDEVFCPVHAWRPAEPAAFGWAPVDLGDEEAIRRSVRAFRPDAIVHCAILNDFLGLYADRRRAWDAYVGATGRLAAAANEVGAKLVLVSTDWVFDGTQAPASEETPPNPINLYGFLKAASELVALERADDAAVARVSGVNGTHWARPDLPRSQDAGFGYFVASIVDALSRSRTFTVWESHAINTRATPSLASDSAERIRRIIERGLRGIFHCCGGESSTRTGLAHLTADVFDLDPGLLRTGPPDPSLTLPAPIPYDTSLSSDATAAALGLEPTPLRELLAQFRDERETLDLSPRLGAGHKVATKGSP